MRPKHLLLILLCFALHPYRSNAQTKYPNATLWRITGHGLTSPCYLFGTMHLQDKRLFYFSDSLYHALETTDGYAMELNPDDMMDSLLNRMDDRENNYSTNYSSYDHSPLLKDVVDQKELKKVTRQLEKKYKISIDKLTTKTLMDDRKHRIYHSNESDTMPTPIDMYLYNISKTEGKWTGGIEDVSDQLSLLDASGADMDPNELIKENDATVEMSLEKMKEEYINQDLNAIDSSFASAYGKYSRYNEMLITKRNVKMARRIDSIASIRTCFFAIGCAHLPGDSGVIALLRLRGFTVEPVFSTTKIAPEKYVPTVHINKPWITVTDDNDTYTVEMPGNPSPITVSSVIPIKMYVDLSDITVYGVGVIAAADDSDLSGKMKALEDSYESRGFDVLDKKEIVMDSVKGIELILQQPSKGYYKVVFLPYKNKLFIALVGGQVKDRISSVSADRFFNSFIISREDKSYYGQWNTITDSLNAFKLLMPVKKEVKPSIKTDEHGTQTKVWTYPDLEQGSYYLVIITEADQGRYFQNDSATFADYKTSLEDEGATHIDSSMFLFHGFPACRYDAAMKKDGEDLSLQAIYVIRGDRLYDILSITEKNKKDFPEVTNFFRSFNFIPFAKTKWDTYTDSNGFITYAPESFTELVDTTDLSKRTFYSKDKNAAIAFTVLKEPLPKYYWTQNDSTYWQSKKEYVTSSDDTLIQFSSFKKKDCIGADFLISVPYTALKKKMHYLVTGDTSYCIFAYLTDEALKEENVNKAFNDFGLSNVQRLSIFDDKTQLILDSLQTTDSANLETVKDALDSAVFTKADLPLLHRALIKTYPDDSTSYNSIGRILSDKIIDLDDSSTVDFIHETYSSLPDNAMPLKLLNILARHHTAASYAVLKKLLLQRTLHMGDTYTLNTSLNDSLELSATLFPEAGSLFGDTTLGACIASVANTLLDSNKIKIEDIKPYEKNLLQLVDWQLPQLQNINSYVDYGTDIINLLGKYNTPASNAMIKRFEMSKTLSYKEMAIITLLKNNQFVSPIEVNKLAADSDYRSYFFGHLEKIGKQNIFPAMYRTQEKLAESNLYASIADGTDEDESMVVNKIIFVKEKLVQGATGREKYFLFKVLLLNADNGAEPARLGICGPYSPDSTKLDPLIDTPKTWEDYDDKFSLPAIDKQFAKFLKDQEDNN